LQFVEQNPVAEPEIGDSLYLASALENAQVSIERDLPQRHNDPDIGEQFEFAFQKGPARPQFLGPRLVVRRGTVRRGSNPGVVKFKPVLSVNALRPGRETGAVE
jgi:hypothetical protein